MTAADAITALVHAYAERLDGGDLDGVAALFADATYGRAGGPLRHGSAEVRAALAVVRLHDGSPRTKHLITNLVVELLAPNERPVQVTDDLASFWRTTYAEVRKQLRGRYPRHDWPEDPTRALPTSRPRRRRAGDARGGRSPGRRG